MLWIMCYLFQGKVKDPLQLYHAFFRCLMQWPWVSWFLPPVKNGDSVVSISFIFLLRRPKNIVWGYRWEQWWWDSIGSLTTTNFSESTLLWTFLAYASSCFVAHHTGSVCSWWIIVQGKWWGSSVLAEVARLSSHYNHFPALCERSLWLLTSLWP